MFHRLFTVPSAIFTSPSSLDCFDPLSFLSSGFHSLPCRYVFFEHGWLIEILSKSTSPKIPPKSFHIDPTCAAPSRISSCRPHLRAVDPWPVFPCRRGGERGRSFVWQDVQSHCERRRRELRSVMCSRTLSFAVHSLCSAIMLIFHRLAFCLIASFPHRSYFDARHHVLCRPPKSSCRGAGLQMQLALWRVHVRPAATRCARAHTRRKCKRVRARCVSSRSYMRALCAIFIALSSWLLPSCTDTRCCR